MRVIPAFHEVENSKASLRSGRKRGALNELALEVSKKLSHIAASAQAEIFEAFQQESEGLGREFEGSGLGLSIVRRLADAHGGTIELKAKKDAAAALPSASQKRKKRSVPAR